MRSRLSKLALPLQVLVLTALSTPALVAADEAWQRKVDPWVLERTARAGDVADALVVLAHQADLAGAAELAGKEAKGRFVFDRLTEAARLTQGPLLAELRARGLEHRPYWIVNMVWVKGDRALVRTLASRADVDRIAANPTVALRAASPVPVFKAQQGPAAGAGEAEWGVEKIDAPDFWDQGFNGQGIVVAGQDTGYDWDHPALQAQYRGWDGAIADHNYNWHDAIHAGGGSCGANSVVPCDDSSHGTHTLGTMIGSGGIGVAPGARWIGCRNMNQGDGTPATYSECFQFFLAPTNLAGTLPDPAKAPHVINNSWGCPPSEGCTNPVVLQSVVESIRAAGIVVVVSAGNSGSGCSSVTTPAAIYDASLTVGSTEQSDNISGFSSRGPVTVDGSNRMKPDISAPGSGIISSVPGGSFGSSSGTSMAGPHVAGAVAVLLSASPGLRGDPDAVESCIVATAVPRTSAQTCGGVPGSQVPNNTFGNGRLRLIWPPDAACNPPGLFADGFETGDTSAWTVVVP